MVVNFGQFSEQCRLWAFDNRVVRDIFGHKREEVVGDWRNLHSEELRNMFFSVNIIRAMKWKIRWELWLSLWKREFHAGFRWGYLKERAG